MLKKLLHIDTSRKDLWLTGGFVLIAAVGLLDYVTGHELSFSLFYLFPVAVIVWFGGRTAGLTASVLSAIIWGVADTLSGSVYSHPAIPVWNSAIRLGVFAIVSLLLENLRHTLEAEQSLSRIDPLTGAANSRHFHELLQAEINRFTRYGSPFTLAYFDLDNFKMVNDRFGHGVGDELLRVVVECMMHQTRKPDVVGRIGGDEFVLLLPETGPLACRTSIEKIRKVLLEKMKNNGWPVTFSVGALTCIEPPGSRDRLISAADNLMYTVKNSGKNRVEYGVFPS